MRARFPRFTTHPWWRLLRFVCVAGVAVGLAAPLAGSIAGVAGVAPGAGAWVFGLCSSALLLLGSWVVLRRDGSRLAALGLGGEPRRRRELLAGFVAGAALFAVVSLARGAAVGASWHGTGVSGLAAALAGLAVSLCLLLPEELVFRGYGFRQLQLLAGSRGALALSAVAFGAYHVAGAGDYAIGAVWRFAMPALGGLVFGVAAVRTGGLALPIGLHWGGNWVQQYVFGLGHAPHASGASQSALWIAPLDHAQVQTLTAPDVLPHLPYLAALALTAGFVVWHSRTPGTHTSAAGAAGTSAA